MVNMLREEIAGIRLQMGKLELIMVAEIEFVTIRVRI
jgi:hypothetical protein